MKNSKVKGLLGLLVLLFAVGLFGFFGYDTMDDIKLGLDLAGGVSITYQAVDENPTSEEMSDTIYKLQQRVQNYSTEAVVYQEGSDRINIDIPGVSDANAILEELGKPGSLIFTDETGKTILTGDQVASAKAGIIEQNGQKSYVVSLTFTEEVQDCCCDQGGDIAIQNCGQCLGETSLDRGFYAVSKTNLLLDTGEDDNIRIHCHTNGKDDTSHARKGQGNIKCSQHDEYQADIQSQGNDSCHTRD